VLTSLLNKFGQFKNTVFYDRNQANEKQVNILSQTFAIIGL